MECPYTAQNIHQEVLLPRCCCNWWQLCSGSDVGKTRVHTTLVRYARSPRRSIIKEDHVLPVQPFNIPQHQEFHHQTIQQHLAVKVMVSHVLLGLASVVCHLASFATSQDATFASRTHRDYTSGR